VPVLVGLLILAAVELTAVIEVAMRIGGVLTVLLLFGVSACGPWLVRRAGFGVWRRARERLQFGEVPGREAVDGTMLLLAGLLICIPGFVTDALGLLLLLPPVRAGVRVLILRRFTRRAQVIVTRTRPVGSPKRGPGHHAHPPHLNP
jgi:UPF0716 protein FxsA